MARLKLEIVTPERRLAQAECDEVIAPGLQGLFGVRPGHTPLISLLDAGPLTVKDGARSTVYFVAGGFVEVGPALVRVLADEAEAAQEIEPAAVQQRLAKAQTELNNLSPSDPKAERVRERIRTETRRLAVARPS